MRSMTFGLAVLMILLGAPLALAENATADPHLAKAIQLRDQATAAYGTGDYDSATDLARQAKQELALIKSAADFPASYTVRLVPDDRDSLSKIAGYPFVYGDKTMWTRLYQANKAQLKHPENADILLPGEVLVIPSIKGEKRTGGWEDGKDYPSIDTMK